MMKRDEWNDRWNAPDWVAGPDPHLLLVNEVQHLRPGSAIDLGCGNGRDSVWLAEHGWAVTGVDFSDVALEKARALARDRGVTVRWEQADLLRFAPPQGFDLVVIMYIHFPPAKRRLLLRMAARALNPGGTLVMVGYHPDHRHARWPNMRDRRRLLSPRTIATELREVHVVKAARVVSEEWSASGVRQTIEVVVRAERRHPAKRAVRKRSTGTTPGT